VRDSIRYAFFYAGRATNSALKIKEILKARVDPESGNGG
jgi:hypothetical protein